MSIVIKRENAIRDQKTIPPIRAELLETDILQIDRTLRGPCVLIRTPDTATVQAIFFTDLNPVERRYVYSFAADPHQIRPTLDRCKSLRSDPLKGHAALIMRCWESVGAEHLQVAS